MKKLAITQLVIVLAVALLASPLWAARESNTDKRADNMAFKTQGALGLSHMLDKTVKDQKGNDLGQIEDVVINNQGQALYGILAGPDNKYYPIPMRTLMKSAKEDHFVLNVSADNFDDKAPGFSRGDWPTELTGREWEQKVFSYYGEQSSGGTMGHTGGGSSNMGTTTQPRSGQ